MALTSLRGRRTRRAFVDSLEPRVMLAGAPAGTAPFISEFLAINTTGITDRLGQRYGWIEIANPTSAPVNLQNYSLTDDAGNLAKWRFPQTVLQPEQYLRVFASGNNVVSGTELHTNFTLNPAGEYLALVAPGGGAADVLSEYAPFPEQVPDVSYGLVDQEEQTSLIRPAAPVRVLVPTDDSTGSAWTAQAFDDTDWTPGTSGVGFDLDTVPPASGFTVRMIDLGAGTDPSIDDLREAVALLDGPVDATRYLVDFDGSADRTAINFGLGGPYGSNLPLPNGATPVGSATVPGREQYALRATSAVNIPAGDWTINVNSDEGFLLKIPGVTFLDRTNDDIDPIPPAEFFTK